MAKRSWIQVRVRAPLALAEAVADLLVRLSGRGVELDEPGPGRMEVTGYLEPGDEEAAVRRALEGLLKESPDARVEYTRLADQDWGRNWKRHFHPRQVLPGLWVGPTWEPPRPGPGEKMLLIDPGQAFGTGQHQSTTLCLTHILRRARAGGLPRRVLDFGCGTGILALAALLYGVQRVVAVDRDPEALAATRMNAERNGLLAGLEITDRAPQGPEQRFDLVLANLILGDLLETAPYLAGRLAPGGELVLSGLLQDQVEQVRQSFGALGLEPKGQEAAGEWAALVLA